MRRFARGLADISNMYENKDAVERFILLGVENGQGDAIESLDELEELVLTAGGTVVDKVIQARDQINHALYFGKGKIDEVGYLIEELGATGIVCDDELSPAQLRNLEQELGTKILDRTQVILDIFAKRASTREGRIQVELAQLRYRATHLIGAGKAMSRLGGGIGTRGPGETKLESDRRVIHNRISVLKKELDKVISHRDVTRSRRNKQGLKTVAIVGYTNAGKSTLMNRLTKSDVLAENKLFATLDPTTRRLGYPDGYGLLLTDTVGFIRKLPHNLIDAFKSSLEEAKYADVILHVVDTSNPAQDTQMDVVYNTLKDLEVSGKPIITAYNKCDLIDTQWRIRDIRAAKTVYISAIKGTGLEDLKQALRDAAEEVE